MVSKRGKYFYNFWRDDQHVRGLWRRTTLDQYRRKQPRWETVLDIDELAKQENENWVYAGTTCLRPKYERCLLSLSRGGGDAVVVREFDTRTKTFVKDGFTLPEAKSSVDWRDENTIYVGTDFGPGSLTSSGYPRIVKLWKRGTPLSEARTLFEGQASDVAVSARARLVPGAAPRPRRAGHRLLRERDLLPARRGGWPAGQAGPPRGRHRLLLPATSCCCSCAATGTVAGKTFPGRRAAGREPEGLPRRQARAGDAVRAGQEPLALRLLGHQERAAAQRAGGRAHPGAGGRPTTRASGTPARCRCRRWAATTPTPSTTMRTTATGSASATSSSRPASSSGICARASANGSSPSPVFFKAEGLETRQFFATSKDGTRIPYFQIAPQGPAARRQPPGAADRLRRLRGPAAARLQPQRGRGLAGGGRRLRGGQHPRRRRIRPDLAPGRASSRTGSGSTTTSSPWPRT